MRTLRRTLIVGGVGASLFFVSPAHSQVCNAEPLFDMSGTDCNVGRQDEECACSECLEWDPAPGATWYEIRRCDSSGTNCTIVGDTRWRNRPAIVGPLGVISPAVRATLWCSAWDGPFPQLGVSYDYSVRACADGASGPVCSSGFSGPVGYVTAPYMCIRDGIEVPCNPTQPPLSSALSDSDGDGVTDAMDADDDGDRVADIIDNCPQAQNLGQRDSDLDGVGDACDTQPRSAGTSPADADRDGIGDGVDMCPWVSDPLQLDTDRDRTGDSCDNCPVRHNEMQTDDDADGQGDACDLNDGPIYAVWTSRTLLTWAREEDYEAWCVYRGDLAELRRSGVYSQVPGSNPRAKRFCWLGDQEINDSANPAAGTTAFYLVSGRPTAAQDELGVDSEGRVRRNDNECP